MSTFKIYEENGLGEERWKWELIDSNGVEIAVSEEAFIKRSINKSIKTLQEKVNESTPVFLDESLEDSDKGYRFEYKQQDDDSWCWIFKAANNKIMAIGGQGFSSKSNIKRSIDNVKVEITRAKIIFKNPKNDPAYDAKQQDNTKENPSIPAGS